MAKQHYDNLQIIPAIGGVDEASDLQDPFFFESVAGVIPYYFGMQQRQSGKKLIDWNPEQKVYAIHQAFNGAGQYGYYVETDHKLYYHVCDAPPDLRIHWIAPLQ